MSPAGSFERCDRAAAAQHGDAVGDLLDLGELVRHQHHRAPARRDAAADVEQRRDLIRQQHGGRLVQHEELGIPDQAFDDLDPLAFADREILDLGEGIERQAVIGGELFELPRAFLAIENAALAAEQHIVDDAHVADQAEMLVHHGDALRQRIRRARRLERRAAVAHARRRPAGARRRSGCTASICRRRSRRGCSGPRRDGGRARPPTMRRSCRTAS